MEFPSHRFSTLPFVLPIVLPVIGGLLSGFGLGSNYGRAQERANPGVDSNPEPNRSDLVCTSYRDRHIDGNRYIRISQCTVDATAP